MNFLFFGSKDKLLSSGAFRDVDSASPMCMYAAVVFRDLFPAAVRKTQQQSTFGTGKGRTFTPHFMIDCAGSIGLQYPLHAALVTMEDTSENGVVEMFRTAGTVPDVMVFVGDEFCAQLNDIDKHRNAKRLMSERREVWPEMSHVDFMTAMRKVHARRTHDRAADRELHVIRGEYNRVVRPHEVGIAKWHPLTVVIGNINDPYIKHCITNKTVPI